VHPPPVAGADRYLSGEPIPIPELVKDGTSSNRRQGRRGGAGSCDREPGSRQAAGLRQGGGARLRVADGRSGREAGPIWSTVADGRTGREAGPIWS